MWAEDWRSECAGCGILDIFDLDFACLVTSEAKSGQGQNGYF